MAYWWLLTMLPFAAFALVALYVGYVAYETTKRREAAAREPPRPDPVDELQQINTELSRAATSARKTLELAREAVQRGTR